MKSLLPAGAVAPLALMFALSACTSQEEMAPKPAAMESKPAPAAKTAAAPAKAKVTKMTGDVGLLDVEKNYMILVTKEGKLVTLDFDEKTKVSKRSPRPAKISDIGLGSAAVVTYTNQGGKNVASSVQYNAKK